VNQGIIEFVMKINITSEFRPPGFQIVVNNGSPESFITKLTIKVKMAVFRNYAIPIFLATLISYSVLVECYSNSANLIIIFAKTKFTTDIRSEAANPNIFTIASVAVDFSSILLFIKYYAYDNPNINPNATPNTKIVVKLVINILFV